MGKWMRPWARPRGEQGAPAPAPLPQPQLASSCVPLTAPHSPRILCLECFLV